MAGGEVTERPVLRLRSLGADAEGERQTVVIHLEEVRPLIEALATAASETAGQIVTMERPDDA